jgi:hypothetical protein
MGDDDLDLIHVGDYREMTTGCRRIYRVRRHGRLAASCTTPAADQVKPATFVRSP